MARPLPDGANDPKQRSAGAGFEGLDNDETRYALIQSLKTSEGAQTFVQSMSMEMLLQDECDWGALLSHAPRALCSMGQCFVIASTPMASSIQLSGSTELKYKSLRANLVHCSDLGRAAFREAEIKLSKVSMYTQYMCEKNGTIEKILKALEDDVLAKHELPRHLEQLKDFAEKCIKDAKSVQDEFLAWQMKAAEIRRVCVDEENRSATQQNDLAKESAGFGVHAKNLAEDIEQLKTDTADAKESVGFYREQFVQASKPYSAGWEGNMQRWIGTAIEGAGSLAQMGASIFAMNLQATKNPLAGFAISIAQKLPYNSTDAESTSKKSEDADDYGFYTARRMIAPLQSLSLCLGDGKNVHAGLLGMDWRSLSGQGDPKFAASTFAKLFRDFQDDPRLVTSNTTISLRVINALVLVTSVLREIDSWVQRERQLQGGGLAGLTIDMAQRWRSEVQDRLSDTTSLAERHKIAEEQYKRTAENAKPKMKGGKRARMTMINQYRENYNASQKVLQDAEKRLRERTDRERKAQEQFNSVQRQLEALEADHLTVDEVRKILSECIGNLHTFQTHLGSLVQFFSQLYTFVDTTYRTRGREFADLSAGLQNMLLDVAPEDRPRFKQARMDELIVESLTLRGSYAVMREIANTYVEVSRKFIMPGVNQVDRLSLTDGSSAMSQRQLGAKVKQISDFANSAQEQINELASKRKKGLQDMLMKRQGEAEAVGFLLEQAQAQGLGRDEDGDGKDGDDDLENAWAI